MCGQSLIASYTCDLAMSPQKRYCPPPRGEATFGPNFGKLVTPSPTRSPPLVSAEVPFNNPNMLPTAASVFTIPVCERVP
eukprot:gene8882-biopygen5738